MIQDDEELAIVQKQLSIVEGIVDSWRRDLLPHNPKNFEIYAEGAVEEAEKLRRQIDDYLARKNARLPDSAAMPAPSDQSASAT
jgi:hypothetical protein